MAVKLVSMTCPKCGAEIDVPEDRDMCFCTYCGAQVLIDDGSYTITHRTIDDARVAEVEASTRIAMEQMHFQQRVDKLWIIAVGVLGIIALIAGLIAAVTGSDGASMTCMAIVAILGWVWLIKQASADDRDKARPLASNEARLPESADLSSSVHLDDLVAQLTSAGFTNIEPVPMHDINLLNAAFIKDGKVEDVQIGGSSKVRAGRAYPKDAHILIRYHSK